MNYFEWMAFTPDRLTLKYLIRIHTVDSPHACGHPGGSRARSRLRDLTCGHFSFTGAVSASDLSEEL